MKFRSPLSPVSALALACLFLASCGGGGGGGSGTGTGTGGSASPRIPPAVEQPPTADGGAQLPGSEPDPTGFANNEPASLSSNGRRTAAIVGGVNLDRALDEFSPTPNTRHAGADIHHLRLRDAVSGAEIARYLRADAATKSGNHVRRWGSTPPTVRLATGATADDRLHTMNAVRLVNSALPADWQLRVDDTPAIRDGKLNPGFIEVAFDPRERWPSGVSTADRVGVALTRFTGSGEITAAGILIDPALVRGERARIGVLLHELLHTLGRGHVDPRAFPDTLMHAYGIRSSDWIHMHPLDEAALYAVYDRLRPGESGDLGLNDLGPWNEVSTHVMGRYGQPGSRVLFGAAWRHGQPRPWAILPDPSPPMRTRPSGSASWSGRLLGLTPRAEAVSGAMDMSLRLSTLRGSLDFTDLEKWAPHAVPGALGTGSRWGDGNLHYGIAVAQGQFITETGGDEGQITGVFSGPRHERVGGTLRRDDLAAGFGGTR